MHLFSQRLSRGQRSTSTLPSTLLASKLDDKSLLKQWKPSYDAGYTMQANLAIVSDAFGLITAWMTKDWRWIAGAILVLANWPFTMRGSMPTNDKLQAIAENDAGPASRAMLETWGRLHSVRTMLGTAATAAYIWALN